MQQITALPALTTLAYLWIQIKLSLTRPTDKKLIIVRAFVLEHKEKVIYYCCCLVDVLPVPWCYWHEAVAWPASHSPLRWIPPWWRSRSLGWRGYCPKRSAGYGRALECQGFLWMDRQMKREGETDSRGRNLIIIIIQCIINQISSN